MAVGVTVTPLFNSFTNLGVLLRRMRVDVTGLVAGANIIPHGITRPENPAQGALIIGEDPNTTSNVIVHRTQPADATNLYYTVDSGAGTTISVYVWV